MKMRFHILLLLIAITSIRLAKAQQIKAVIRSEGDSSYVEGVHIRNMNQQTLAISNEKGFFEIPAKIGDTLVLSNVNYKTRALVYAKLSEYISIYLTPNTIQLEEVIVSNMPKNISEFKRQIVEMEMQPSQEFVPYGMNPAPPKSKIPMNYDRSRVNTVKYAVNKPISFIVKQFSKGYKEKVKYYETIANKGHKIAIDKKYNPELVQRLTLLEGDKLANFIQFMDVDPSFINRSTDYEIAVHIQQKFEQYLSIQKNNLESIEEHNNG